MAVLERVERQSWIPSRSWRRDLAVGAAVVAVVAVVALSAHGTFSQFGLRSLAVTPSAAVTLILFALWSYSLRIVRWHVLLRTLSPNVPLKLSLHTQVVGFTFATTPGRIGELYKLRMVERASGLPIAQSLPAVAVERLTDVAAFGSLAVIGGWLSWTGSTGAGQTGYWAALGLTMAALVAFYQIGSRQVPHWRSGRLAATAQSWAVRLLRRFPGAGRLLNQFQVGATRVANPKAVGISLACVVLGRLGDAMVIYEIARLAGHPISVPMAMLFIAAAGLAGGLSLLPGGVGSAEAAMVGLILAQGVPADSAMTIALYSRTLIFWGWVVLGLLVFVVGTLVVAVAGGRREARSSPFWMLD